MNTVRKITTGMIESAKTHYLQIKSKMENNLEKRSILNSQLAELEKEYSLLSVEMGKAEKGQQYI